MIHSTTSFSEELNKPHGHTLNIEFLVEGSLNNRDYLIDLTELEKIITGVAESYNRALVISRENIIKEKHLDKIFSKIVYVERGDATLENIAIEISKKIFDALRDHGSIDKVILRIYEGNRYIAEVEYP
ncbi:MAG: 6-carboxytetrahydropterin synthase [Sulfolobales archaeon]